LPAELSTSLLRAFQIVILSVDAPTPAHTGRWSSGEIAFCFGGFLSRRRKSLPARRLQKVDPRGKRIAIDKMNSFCRSSAAQNAAFLDQTAMVDRQNRGAFCS
jgi:hypothetical protein